VRSANPSAVYCCDPVMGDVGRGFFVRPGIPEFMRDTVVPSADIVTPNQFELEFLTGREPGAITDSDQLLAAVAQLRAAGPSTVLVTSVTTTGTDDGTISMVAVTGEGSWRVDTPKLPLSVNGAGDATAALFLAHCLQVGARRALELTAASIFGVLEVTEQGGYREIQLIRAQDELANPSHAFRSVELVRGHS
jgi:pyridoxine kinase